MKTRLAIVCWRAGPSSPHLCATPFFHALAAAAMDVDVEMYFTAESVLLLKQGVAGGLPTGPQQRETVHTFMARAAAEGVRFYACSQALQEYGLARADLIAEVAGIAGAATYVARGLDENWASVVY